MRTLVKLAHACSWEETLLARRRETNRLLKNARARRQSLLKKWRDEEARRGKTAGEVAGKRGNKDNLPQSSIDGKQGGAK